MIYTTTQDLLIHIRHKMLDKNISIQDIADMSNKSHSTISSALRRKNITLETLNDLCQALGYNLEINLVEKE